MKIHYQLGDRFMPALQLIFIQATQGAILLRHGSKTFLKPHLWRGEATALMTSLRGEHVSVTIKRQ